MLKVAGFSAKFDTVKNDLDFIKKSYSSVTDMVQSIANEETAGRVKFGAFL